MSKRFLLNFGATFILAVAAPSVMAIEKAGTNELTHAELEQINLQISQSERIAKLNLAEAQKIHSEIELSKAANDKRIYERSLNGEGAPERSSSSSGSVQVGSDGRRVTATQTFTPDPIDSVCAINIYGAEGNLRSDVFMRGKKHTGLGAGGRLPENVRIESFVTDGPEGWAVVFAHNNTSRQVPLCDQTVASSIGVPVEREIR